MRRFFIAAAVAIVLAAPSTLAQDWVRILDVDRYATGKDVALSDDGLYVAGYRSAWPSALSYWTIVRYTLGGDVVWTESLPTLTAFALVGMARIAYSRAGLLVFGGVSQEASTDGPHRSYVFARDTASGLLWQHVFESNYTQYGYYVDVVADSSGNAYVATVSSTDSTEADWRTLKVARNGDIVWDRVYDGAGHFSDFARAVAIDSSGRVYVAGSTTDESNAIRPTIVNYLPDGTLGWVSPPPPVYGSFDGIAVGPDGQVYAVGFTSQADSQTLVVKYTPEGESTWCRWISGKGQFLAIDPLGNLCITGQTPDGQDIKTWKVDANGSTLWEHTWDGPERRADCPNAIATDRSGNVVVTGYTTTWSGNDIATIAYSAEGEQLWAECYRRGYDYWAAGNAVGTDSAGNVYLTGYTNSRDSTRRWITMRYPPSGVRVQERETAESVQQPASLGSTIIRGILNLQSAIYSLQSEIVLLDISGRKVLDLHPGANDVRSLAPGVYFVKEHSVVSSQHSGKASVTKVVLAR